MTIGVNHLVVNLLSIGEDIIVIGVGNNKVDRIKICTKNIKSKSKNSVKSVLTKFQTFA